MNTAILLGAGSSVAAGFPSTSNLTERVLSGAGVKRHTDESYFIEGNELPDETTLIVNFIARRLYAKAERYYSEYDGRLVNYEDIFYLAMQASDDLTGEMENPAVRPFVDELRSDMLSIAESCRISELESMRSHELKADTSPSGPELFWETAEYLDSGDLDSLPMKTSNYIADIVWRSLCHEPEPDHLCHLNLIVHTCKNADVTSISTLCHDTHVEKFLIEQGITLSDGFSEPQNDVRYWKGDFVSSVPFIKLHGSVNWFRLRPEEGDWYDERIGIPVNGDYWHTRTVGDVLQRPLDGRPLLLIGTFNKIATYSSGIFRELHYQFRSSINKADQIVICGYSFGDKGINAEIIEWYYNKQGRRLVIIHPDPDSLVANARGAIRNKWDDWRDSGSIELISKQIEEVCLDEFEEVIT